MEIRQLKASDTKQFCELVKNMYSHLENLEWFSPMPFDEESVMTMLEKPRFYIVGAFENDELCGVSSLDYKCGKLIGKINFPEGCNADKLVEIGFNIVHTKHRGKGIMKLLVSHLINKLKWDGFKWAFAKVHKDNFASLKSLQKNGFEIFESYAKPVSKVEFEQLLNQTFFSPVGRINGMKTLQKFEDADEIVVDYNILTKQL